MSSNEPVKSGCEDIQNFSYIELRIFEIIAYLISKIRSSIYETFHISLHRYIVCYLVGYCLACRRNVAKRNPHGAIT